MAQHLNFINGEWVAAQAGASYTTTNPAKPQEVVGKFPRSDVADAANAMKAAAAARATWMQTPGPQRGVLLLRFAQLLEEHKTQLGRIITLEMGKSLAESVGEVGRAASEVRFMAGEASRPTGEVHPSERAGITCHTLREPLGTIACITPWNFPVVAPVRKIAPALAYGNTVVCKPATQTPWCSIFIFSLLREAGLPPGVANLVIGPGASLGEALVNDPRASGISFTGSSEVGLRLHAAAARRLAGVQLELGGKNPALVLDCDDLDGAAREIVSAAFLCSGQRCTALSRVVVLHDQADALVERLVHHVNLIKVGDGLVEGTTMGPLANLSQLRGVERYVREGLAAGARLITGGQPLTDNPESAGFYHEPTLFDHVKSDSALAREEIFGPVLPVIRVAGLDEAIAVANDTPYGLAAAIFTRRADFAQQCISRIQAGMIHVNHGTASQAHLPFGGRKLSGYGAYSIGSTAREFFTTMKVVYAR